MNRPLSKMTRKNISPIPNKTNMSYANNNKGSFPNKYLLLKFFDLGTKRLQLYQLLQQHNITPITLNAISVIPREFFLPYKNVELAYEDRPIPISFNQTISQPSLVCKMIDKLEVNTSHNVLEIGTGIGYNASILSLLSREVVTIEIIKGLVRRASARINFCQQNGILKNNISLIHGDGNKGYIQNAPFDRIIVTCGAFEEIPPKLLEQLAEGGIMIIPIKERQPSGQILELINIIRKINGKISIHKDISVRFVPFVRNEKLVSKKII